MFLTIENVFFYLIYIDIYTDTYISGSLTSSFDLSCTDEISRSETAVVYRSISIVYIYTSIYIYIYIYLYIYMFYIYIYINTKT